MRFHTRIRLRVEHEKHPFVFLPSFLHCICCYFFVEALLKNYKFKHGKRGQNLMSAKNGSFLHILMTSNEVNFQTVLFVFCLGFKAFE